MDLKTQIVNRIISREGLFALISVALIWWIATGVSADIRSTRDDLKMHAQESAFYAKQSCLALAVLSGMPKEGCQR